MDHDTLELIGRLCTEAGNIMEDVSPLAISRLPADSQQTRTVIAGIWSAGMDISALAAAAEVIARRAS
jgi:hypothetical protein